MAEVKHVLLRHFNPHVRAVARSPRFFSRGLTAVKSIGQPGGTMNAIDGDDPRERA
jgi:hypothetical protein